MTYNIHPRAHTSIEGEFPFYFPDNTSGDIYFSVPVSTSGLNTSATPDIPKSAILFK